MMGSCEQQGFSDSNKEPVEYRGDLIDRMDMRHSQTIQMKLVQRH